MYNIMERGAITKFVDIENENTCREMYKVVCKCLNSVILLNPDQSGSSFSHSCQKIWVQDNGREEVLKVGGSDLDGILSVLW